MGTPVPPTRGTAAERDGVGRGNVPDVCAGGMETLRPHHRTAHETGPRQPPSADADGHGIAQNFAPPLLGTLTGAETFGPAAPPGGPRTDTGRIYPMKVRTYSRNSSAPPNTCRIRRRAVDFDTSAPSAYSAAIDAPPLLDRTGSSTSRAS